MEVSRREMEAGILPDADADTYMKVTLPYLVVLSLDYSLSCQR